jgi:3-oxoacyl-[acyl-carrier-protein] synthase III
MQNYYSKILGVGSYLPEKILTNDDLSKIVDTSDEWITTRTGIKERHIAGEEERPVSMAEQSAKRALKNAGISIQDVDLIIVTTTNPENFFPSTACLLHGRLGAKPSCFAFDLVAACTGDLYALTVADQFIRTGKVKTALVVSAEIMSRLLDWTDRNTCVIFGDGSGAFVLQASSEPGIIDANIYADGQKSQLGHVSTGLYGPREKGLYMHGKELFKFAVEAIVDTIGDLLAKNNIDISKVDWIIPHQANARILDFAVEKLHYPKEKVILTIEKHGNTSSASIPLAFDNYLQQGKIKRGDLIILIAFGSGLAWGAALIKY